MMLQYLYSNIVLKLCTTQHGSMHYKIGVTVYTIGPLFLNFIVITRQTDPPFQNSAYRVMSSRLLNVYF